MYACSKRICVQVSERVRVCVCVRARFYEVHGIYRFVCVIIFIYLCENVYQYVCISD